MSIPTNGMTAEVFRQAMPPYQLSADLLAAMFTAIPAPPPDATVAWRETRATRLVHEASGLMPADAPQARIAAQIVIYKEAAENAVRRSDASGITVEQVCRLLRTAAALTVSTAALERSMVRHLQKPVPFFGTLLAEGIDIAALAAGWGGSGLRGKDAEGLAVGADLGMPAAETAAGSSALGQDLPVMTGDPAVAVEPGPAITEDAVSDDDAEAPGGDGGLTDGLVPLAAAGSALGSNGPGQAPDATCGVVTRLDQGPGWTLDVVRRRKAGEGVAGAGAGENVASGTSAIAAAADRIA